ncbi:HDOD domain-containing protein [Beggiatoa alba]|nr:HDOD domain-containing protein [Beggiatoa alba]
MKVKSTQATIEHFTGFNPFGECSEEQLIVLASNALLDNIPRGYILARSGESDGWDYYLIEGTLKLVAEDGKERFIMAGSDTARSPVARLQPRRYTLSAMTSVKLLRVSTILLQNFPFSGLEKNSGVDVEEDIKESEDISGNPLFNEIQADLQADRLVVPSMPDVALNIRRMIESDDVSLQKVAQLINTDLAISAKIVKTANGSLYHGMPRVDTCARAIARLGLNTTKHLVISFVLRNLFQEKITHEILKDCMQELWNHSVEIAATSMALANITPGIEAEEALLIGLLHDIGELVILTYADSYPDICADSASLQTVVTQLKAEIGAAILRDWQFPEAFIITAANAENWMRESEAGPDYCDVVLVAHLHSYIGTKEMKGIPSLDEVPAFGKLADGNLTPEVSMQVLDDSKEMLQEIKQLLSI